MYIEILEMCLQIISALMKKYIGKHIDIELLSRPSLQKNNNNLILPKAEFI